MLLSEALAKALQEALELSHSDICKALSDELNDQHPGQYCYICDVYGDDQSGDVVYSLGGNVLKAPYEIGEVNGKRVTAIDEDQAINVVPRTVYDEEADDDDHYAGMSDADADEARKLSPEERRMMFAERFISKDERDAADTSDFAGKGKSFPILKPGDVMAAVRSMGRAGSGNKSTSALKASIIRIAKRKGWTKYLPKAWQEGGDNATESADLEVTGDVIPLREGAVGQDGTAYLKLIAPGWGSSGYYASNVLERDGAEAFPKGTKNFWDHQTRTEESERPEGSLRDLASVLTEDAHYEANGPAGPGLYAKAKVFEQFRQPVDDLAKHIGVSIRAVGKAREGKADGKTGPIIEKLSRGISADYVTTPGAGGQVLQLFEAARGRQIPTQESDDMTKEEVQAAVREAISPFVIENKRLKQQVALILGPNVLREALREIRLPEASKARVIERLQESVPLTEAGAVDSEALKKLVDTECLREAEFLEALGLGRVQGLGTAPPADPKQAKRAAKEVREAQDDDMKALSRLFCGEGDENKAKRKAFREGRAA